MAADLVDEGRISLVVIAALAKVVERADVFAAQTLDDDDDHIVRDEGSGVGRIVLGGEDGIEFFLRCEISGIGKRLLAQRANVVKPPRIPATVSPTMMSKAAVRVG